MDFRQRRGRLGEDVAAEHLEAKGWTVLDRNWRARRKEVDLVVRKGDTVAFVEVKARRGAQCGHPLESITPGKRREVEAVAREWLRSRGPELGGVSTVRFDAVAVQIRPGRPPLVEHVPHAWEVGFG
jgi:putative endonuclease